MNISFLKSIVPIFILSTLLVSSHVLAATSLEDEGNGAGAGKAVSNHSHLFYPPDSYTVDGKEVVVEDLGVPTFGHGETTAIDPSAAGMRHAHCAGPVDSKYVGIIISGGIPDGKSSQMRYAIPTSWLVSDMMRQDLFLKVDHREFRIGNVVVESLDIDAAGVLTFSNSDTWALTRSWQTKGMPPLFKNWLKLRVGDDYVLQVSDVGDDEVPNNGPFSAEYPEAGLLRKMRVGSGT